MESSTGLNAGGGEPAEAELVRLRQLVAELLLANQQLRYALSARPAEQQR